MILKLNIQKDDLLLWAKYQQYRPSSKDLTKEEMATEFVIGQLEEQIWVARIKDKKQAITAERPVITSAS